MHLHRRIECLSYLRLALSLLFHPPIPVGLLHGTSENTIGFLLRYQPRERRIPFAFALFEETFLQVVQVFCHRLFCIALHTRIDGGVYFQTVLVDIVVRTVGLGILLAEAIQRVVVPLIAVDGILLFVPLRVVALFRFFGGQHATQILSEIGSQALLVVHRRIMQFYRQCLQRIALGTSDILIFAHLAQYGVASVEGTLMAANRVVERRVLTHTDQHGRLLYFQVCRCGGEIDLRSRFDTYCVVQKVELVEIHQQYLIFRVQAFQFGGNHPLYRFLHGTLEYVICTRRPNLLGELLCERTTAAGTPQFQHCTEKRLEIDAGVVVKAGIFCGDQRIDYIRTEVGILHADSVLTAVVAPQRLHIGGEYLAGELIFGVLQFVDRRQIAYFPFGYQYNSQHGNQESCGE